MLDPAFVQVLRNLSDPFVSNLLSRLSLAAETHNKDETMVILTEVSSRLLRQPSSIASHAPPAANSEPSQSDLDKVYLVTTQLNHTLSVIHAGLDRSHLWTIYVLYSTQRLQFTKPISQATSQD
jgi:chitin synthase